MSGGFGIERPDTVTVVLSWGEFLLLHGVLGDIGTANAQRAAHECAQEIKRSDAGGTLKRPFSDLTAGIENASLMPLWEHLRRIWNGDVN